MRVKAACVLAMVALACAGPKEGDKRGITPEDYYQFENIGDARISPDGKLVAYTVVTVDQKQNRRLSEVWLVSTDGHGTPAQFTTAPSSRNPRWTPDGRAIGFISTRPEVAAGGPNAAKPQVYLLPM